MGRQVACWPSVRHAGAVWAQRTAPPYRPACSIVWGAPAWCSSGGRSAVQTMSEPGRGAPRPPPGRTRRQPCRWCTQTTWSARGQRQAKRVEAGTPLVETDVHARGARPGPGPAASSATRADHGVGDPGGPTRRPGWRRRWPVRSPAVPLHVEVRGSGPPLVLLHGFTQTGRLWGTLRRDLAKAHTLVGDRPARSRRVRRRAGRPAALRPW